ncbi:MAG: hypothetical protein IKB06_03400 [Clostridia bacterium]|nr:hypothetical protein [Clostridia bacterium]
MKILMEVCVILFFGYVGFQYKKSFKEKERCLVCLLDYVRFLDSNISLFKNDVVEIINNYKIMHKNKNANYINFFKNNNSKIQIDENILKLKIKNNETIYFIVNTLNNFGVDELEHEKEKLKKLELFIENKITKANKETKEKGEVYFKIFLAVGAVVGICLW